MNFHPGAVLAAILSLVLAGCGGGAGVQRGGPLELAILHINDHHSNLEADERASLLLDTGAGREALNLSLGGFPRVTAAMDQLAQRHPQVLRLHAGDATTGTLYYTLFEGAADAALMNTVCFDAMSPGNHEFDHGDAGLRKFMDFLHGGDCRTPLLSANLRPGPASPLTGAGIAPYTVVERGGQPIGIVGLTTAVKTMKSSRPDPGTILGSEAEAAQAAIDALQAQGVRHVVVLSHQGYRQDQALAAQLSGVDVIVGGDSHTLLGPPRLRAFGLEPAGDYPTLAQDRQGSPVCVVQAWQYSRVVGELVVRFDGEGRVQACAGQPHVLIGDSFRRNGEALGGEALAAVQAQVAAEPVLRVTAPDAAAAALLAPYREQLEAYAGRQVGVALDPLCLRRVPGTTRDPGTSKLAGCNEDPRVIAHGGDVQQLVAAAFLAQGRRYGGADLSIQNAGGVRVDLPAGPLTVRDVYTVLPFKNTFVRLRMSGEEVKAALEDAMEAVVGGSTGGYPYTADLRWQVDLNQPRGSRVFALELKDAAGVWRPFDPAGSYQVITIDFLASGQDGYPTLGRIPAERREELFLAYADSFLKYLETHPQLQRLPLSDYSTQRFTDTR